MQLLTLFPQTTMQFDTALLLFYEQVLIYLWQNEMVDAYDTLKSW